MKIRHLILFAAFCGLLTTIAYYAIRFYHQRVEDQQMITAFQHFAQDKIAKDGIPILTSDFATTARHLVIAGYLSSNDFQHFDHNGFSEINWRVRSEMTNLKDGPTEVLSSGILPSGRVVAWQFPITNVTIKVSVKVSVPSIE